MHERLAELRRDVRLEDLAMLALAIGWTAGWVVRVHDRRVWASGLAAGVAMQHVVDEHNADHPEDRAELVVARGPG